MRVVQLPGVDSVRVTCDGEEFTAWHAVGADAIELDLTIGDHELIVRTDYHGGAGADVPRGPRERAVRTPAVVTGAFAPPAHSSAAAPNPSAIAVAARSCRCY